MEAKGAVVLVQPRRGKDHGGKIGAVPIEDKHAPAVRPDNDGPPHAEADKLALPERDEEPVGHCVCGRPFE